MGKRALLKLDPRGWLGALLLASAGVLYLVASKLLAEEKTK